MNKRYVLMTNVAGGLYYRDTVEDHDLTPQEVETVINKIPLLDKVRELVLKKCKDCGECNDDFDSRFLCRLNNLKYFIAPVDLLKALEVTPWKLLGDTHDRGGSGKRELPYPFCIGCGLRDVWIDPLGGEQPWCIIAYTTELPENPTSCPKKEVKKNDP